MLEARWGKTEPHDGKVKKDHALSVHFNLKDRQVLEEVLGNLCFEPQRIHGGIRLKRNTFAALRIHGANKAGVLEAKFTSDHVPWLSDPEFLETGMTDYYEVTEVGEDFIEIGFPPASLIKPARRNARTPKASKEDAVVALSNEVSSLKQQLDELTKRAATQQPETAPKEEPKEKSEKDLILALFDYYRTHALTGEIVALLDELDGKIKQSPGKSVEAFFSMSRQWRNKHMTKYAFAFARKIANAIRDYVE